MNTFVTVFFALCSSCLLSPAAPQSAATSSQTLASSPSEYFPSPKQGMSIQVNVEKTPRLQDLLSEFSRVTGQTVLSDEATRKMLESTNCGLNQNVEVPAAQVYAFTESVLSYHGFILYHLRSEPPRLLGIMHPRAMNDASNTVKPIYVPVEVLGVWKDHPAFLVQTMLTLPNVDVRTLSNSMRQMFTDNRTQQIIPLGNSNSLLISGTAGSVTNIVTMLQRCEQEAAKQGLGSKPESQGIDPVKQPK